VVGRVGGGQPAEGEGDDGRVGQVHECVGGEGVRAVAVDLRYCVIVSLL
jgi:hypothetical protein